MTKKYCHRCLMNFKCHIRLLTHLKKDQKCTITNNNYDVSYEKQLMILMNRFFIDL